MPTKRKLQDKLQEGKAVDTQALAAEIDEEIKARNEQAKNPAAVSYVVVKPFEIDGEKYEAGETFTPRKSWVRDLSFEEFRSTERKNRAADLVGVAFTVPGDVINKKTGERAIHRQILPIKEA